MARPIDPMSIEQNKPWEREGISRKTWYNRRKREEERTLMAMSEQPQYDPEYEDKLQRSYKASLILCCSHAEALKICR